MALNEEKLKTNEVAAPTLFVGVGGTGCKIVKKVADLCAPEEKENINFLCLDTNVNDLSSVANGKTKIFWVQTSNTQTVGSYLDYDDDARKKWFPKNAVMYDKTVSEGAGQVRAISRLALNSTIKTGKIRPLYDSIDDLFRKTGKEMKQAMRVVIASTASGGTGSGILLPLSMFIRDYVKEKYPNTSLIVRALVLLPETLDSVIDSQTERDSQARNAYATIKEINAFMMKGSGFIDLDEDLKQFSGLRVDVSIAGSDRQKTLSLLPMDFCFLMDGQDAEDSTMISINQYIEQAAQALYEQNIGPMQKKAFSVEDNIIKEMTKPGNYGRNRFGGIGAGVIRYPYEKIANYVAYDLAIDSIGGDGEATKWTKYDNSIKAYKAEQKKRGIPMSTWDSDGKVYMDTLRNAKDPFSTDLNNTFELDAIDSKIKKYKKSLEDQAYRVVLGDKRFAGVYDAAKSWETHNTFGETEEKIADAVAALGNYREAVETRSKDGNPIINGIVGRWIEAVFTNEQKTVAINDSYSIESIIKNAQGEVFHPCAARYALYRLKEEFEKEVKSTQAAQAAEYLDSLKNKEFEFKFSKDKIIGVEGLASLERDPNLFDKLKGYKKLYAEANQELPAYFMAIDDYCKKASKHAAYVKANEYLKAFIEEYENFFSTFVYKVKDLRRNKVDLVDELKYKKGDSFVNICATEELLGELSKYSLQKAQKETTMLNSDINGSIFDAVKNNAIFKMELDKAGDGYIDEDRRVNIFDDILLGYFKNSVLEKCEDIDKDIIGAIELEQRLKERIRLRSESGGDKQVFEQVTIEDAQRHIIEVIAMGARIAAPSIQRATNEEPREIKVCAYNKSLLDNRRFRVKDLIPNGEAVETISKYEIHFYNALYNLTPNKIKKFAAPFDTETGHKDSGTYHKAYFEYAKLIGPDSTKNAAISTHIDKRWDSIKSMPELDFGYQQIVIKKIHKAFIYGLVHNAIQQKSLSAVANGKKVFVYRNSDNRDVELVVPNGTMCDEFYEILGALYVNSKVVEDIGLIKSRKRAMSEAKNCNYEDTEFFRDMANFNLLRIMPDCEDPESESRYDGTQKSLDELKEEIARNKEDRTKEGGLIDYVKKTVREDDSKLYVENPTSLFAIPLMYYCSLPNSGRFISEISTMVDSVIDVFREEYTKWEKEEDVKFVLCTRLTDELNLLKKNYSYFEEHMHAPAPHENPVVDIIQRKIREVIMSAPEPEDYEVLLDKVAKEFNEKQ
ncbi:MAG: tubulin-like doman-containing protein [Clostridiales bacterium]|nr:tubulin-like doman-containing protein [Clostridiales bacterium]